VPSEAAKSASRSFNNSNAVASLEDDLLGDDIGDDMLGKSSAEPEATTLPALARAA
jgi:hypothetical protein